MKLLGYVIAGFLMVGLAFGYPHIKGWLGLTIPYSAVVVFCFVVLGFVVTPLYWKEITKKGKQERQNEKRAAQPWEQ